MIITGYTFDVPPATVARHRLGPTIRNTTMEICCPGCAHPIHIPDLSDDDVFQTVRTFTSVDCPNCGPVALGKEYEKTAVYRDSDDGQVTQVAHFTLLKKLGRG